MDPSKEARNDRSGKSETVGELLIREDIVASPTQARMLAQAGIVRIAGKKVRENDPIWIGRDGAVHVNIGKRHYKFTLGRDEDDEEAGKTERIGEKNRE